MPDPKPTSQRTSSERSPKTLASEKRGTASAHKRAKAPPPKPAGWLAYLTLIALTIGCYGPIFTSGLVWSEYDDVERSPYQSMEKWTEAWAPQMIRYEDPITLTSYFLERAIPLDAAVTHHAINLLLHLCAAVLLLKTLEALKLSAAFSAALIFALHPALLQTIFWSGYRTELVGLVFLLVALYLGVRNRNSRDFWTMTIISAIGYLIHPATLVLPFLLGLCIFHQKGSFHLKDYNRLLPLLCLALFIGVWTQANRPGQELLLNERLGIYAQNLFFYLNQALLPLDQLLFHPFAQGEGYRVGAQNSILPFALFIPFYVLIAIFYKKPWARGVLMGLTAYLLLSIYGITRTGTFVDGSSAHENYLQYFTVPIILALIICTAGGIARNMGTAGKILWYTGFGVFALLQLAITYSYAQAVSDRAQMWYRISEEWPEAWLPKLALIDTIQESGEKSDLLSQNDIIDMLTSILDQQPDRIKERILLARIYRDGGQKNNALVQYKRILRDSKPTNEFLLEAATLYDELGLTWDANNARARMTK